MKKCSKWIVSMLLCALVLAFLGCGKETLKSEEYDATETTESTESTETEFAGITDEEIDEILESIENAKEMTQEEFEKLEFIDEGHPENDVVDSEAFLVVIDAGHQRKGNSKRNIL